MLSVVIVNYKTPDLLRECIESLRRTVLKTPYEVIVVDSESDGTAVRMLANLFPSAAYIPFKENTGYGKGVNAGIARANGEYILILNPDVVARPHAVDELAFFMRTRGRDEMIGMAGPRLLWPDGSFQPSAFRFYSPLTIVLRRTFLGHLPAFKSHLDRFFMKDKGLQHARDAVLADWLRGGAIIVSREAVEKIGNMDERFFMYFEDVDWARRFWENGWKVAYFPGSTFVHHYPRASHRFGLLGIISNRLTRTHIASGMKYFMKYRFKTTHYA